MRKPYERTIDNVDYVLYQLDPFTASEIMTRLLKILGKPLVKLITARAETKEGGEKKSLLDMDIDPAVAGSAIGELMANLKDSDIRKLTVDIFAQDLLSYKDEDKEEFKKIKSIKNHITKTGTLLHLTKLLKWGLEVNFMDFFKGLGELKE